MKLKMQDLYRTNPAKRLSSKEAVKMFKKNENSLLFHIPDVAKLAGLSIDEMIAELAAGRITAVQEEDGTIGILGGELTNWMTNREFEVWPPRARRN